MTSYRSTNAIKRVAIIGGGVIGSGWTARCLARNIDVVVFDPADDAQSRLDAALDLAWQTLYDAGRTTTPERPAVAVVSSLAEAVSDADFVQECVPEREELKITLFEELGGLVPADVVLASSTSGLLPSRLQSRCKHPDRLVVGHPFAPVYLLPLVEIVRGEHSTIDAAKAAGDFYTDLGMRPLYVRKEIEAFVADRLQDALYREALHLINDGVASVEEIDAAITGGPGMRWAFMGTFMAWHLGGGPGGMRHTIDQFGPMLDLPWSKLVPPTLTDELKSRIVDGCEREAGAREFSDLEKRRDQCLIAIQKALDEYWYPSEQDGWPAFDRDVLE